MHKSIIICIKMVSEWNLLSCLAACSSYLGKQIKAIFASGLFVRMNGNKETVDTFIKYGNLLNGL